ncbi:hypothetical protein DLAC_09055 [Tieghemostelium lacteum]|uniref:Uncharacterized protein n=1 Tax=Tieghemostelium lacteum TaxID=361077 RepID=A0A151Z922_TIELA|nr:hypothetical protein DLAC_09055 [Tieghemostelium lacteum]|eukprot:KYQ90433.1 hypothetical protein DLAC_09055 [Tieghemostelium lacteum]
MKSILIVVLVLIALIGFTMAHYDNNCYVQFYNKEAEVRRLFDQHHDHYEYYRLMNVACRELESCLNSHH